MPLPLLAVVLPAVAGLGGVSGAWLFSWFRGDENELPVETLWKGFKEYYGDREVFTRTQIKSWWAVYLRGVTEKKLKPFDYRDNPTVLQPQQQPIVSFMASELGASTVKVREFCYMLQLLVSKGKLDRRFWDPLSSLKAAEAVAAWKKKNESVAPSAPAQASSALASAASTVKWVAAGLLGFVALRAVNLLGEK